ncbi:hypothetical protein B0H14DRAFT_3135111 [Mycena olivaceomarginata]|nr:hypothetical protein B0H14DRAFT_3135111 [Mycena olivaceomarginata]
MGPLGSLFSALGLSSHLSSLVMIRRLVTLHACTCALRQSTAPRVVSSSCAPAEACLAATAFFTAGAAFFSGGGHLRARLCSARRWGLLGMGSFLGQWAGHGGSGVVVSIVGTWGLVLLILIGVVFITHALAGLAGIATRCTMLGNDLPCYNVIIEVTLTSPHCLKEHADDCLRGTKFAGVDRLRFVLAQNNHKTTTTTIYSSKDYATNGFGTNTIRLLDFNKAVQQHASTTQLPTTIPLAPGMGRVIWVGYKVAGSLDRGHQGRVCRHYKHPASDPTHYDSASINIGVKENGLESTHNHLAGDPTHYEYIGVKAKLLAQLLAGSRREHPWFIREDSASQQLRIST